MFILKKGHQPGVYVPLRALFLVRCIISLFEEFDRKMRKNSFLFIDYKGIIEIHTLT